MVSPPPAGHRLTWTTVVMPYEFATATEIVFGAGSSQSCRIACGARVRSRSSSPAPHPARSAALLDGIRAAGVGRDRRGRSRTSRRWTMPGRRRELAREQHVDVVVAIGGGSAIDLAKAVAALATNGGDPLDYLEVIGRGQPLVRRPLPFIAVPTTAGAGAEVTRNAVLASPGDGVKASLRSPLMLPRLALVDPELTLTLPRDVTAATGMDALAQLLEPYVSVRANPITDPLCLDGLARVARSLRRAWTDGADLDARTDMSLAALFGGLALANAGLGAVHGFAAAIGGRFDAPHGAVCAALLPDVVRANVAGARGARTRVARGRTICRRRRAR